MTAVNRAIFFSAFYALKYGILKPLYNYWVVMESVGYLQFVFIHHDGHELTWIQYKNSIFGGIIICYWLLPLTPRVAKPPTLGYPAY